MSSWLKKILSTNKKAETSSVRDALAEISPTQNNDTDDNTTPLPYNEEAVQRVKKMFSRYNGIELMDKLKEIVSDLRAEESEK